MISIIGAIDFDSFKEFHIKLKRFEVHQDPVMITLSSPGGDALAALAFFERIRTSPCDITITAMGYCASAAVLILAAGDIRRMSRNAWVMVHEEQDITIKGFPLHQSEKALADYRRIEDQWNRLLASVTEIDASHWSGLHKRESYLTVEDCLVYGLVEEVI